MKKMFSLAAFCLAAFVDPFGTTSILTAAELKTAPAQVAEKRVPKIQFETNFFDFGKITAVETISGVFKFRNVGDGLLKVDPPKPGCDCTESKVIPNSLAPGESGEIIYTIKLEHAAHNEQKYIRVHSNDAETPNVELTMQFDYTPLYELSPAALWLMLPAGKEKVQKNFTVTRTDGKPLQIDRLATSQKWISAAFAPSFQPQDSSAQIDVTIHRPPDLLPMINATVEMWSSHQTSKPIKTLFVVGEVQGELTAVPPKLYWVFPDLGKNKADYPSGVFAKTVELKASLGNSVEIKSVTSTIKGMIVKIVPKEAGKTFDMILKFDELPQTFSNGKVIIETSLASLPKLEVPVTIAVP